MSVIRPNIQKFSIKKECPKCKDTIFEEYYAKVPCDFCSDLFKEPVIYKNVLCPPSGGSNVTQVLQ